MTATSQNWFSILLQHNAFNVAETANVIAAASYISMKDYTGAVDNATLDDVVPGDAVIPVWRDGTQAEFSEEDREQDLLSYKTAVRHLIFSIFEKSIQHEDQEQIQALALSAIMDLNDQLEINIIQQFEYAEVAFMANTNTAYFRFNINKFFKDITPEEFMVELNNQMENSYSEVIRAYNAQ